MIKADQHCRVEDRKQAGVKSVALLLLQLLVPSFAWRQFTAGDQYHVTTWYLVAILYWQKVSFFRNLRSLKTRGALITSDTTWRQTTAEVIQL